GGTRNCEQRAGEAEGAGQQCTMRERHGTSLRKLLLRDVMLCRSPTYAVGTQGIRPAIAGDAFGSGPGKRRRLGLDRAEPAVVPERPQDEVLRENVVAQGQRDGHVEVIPGID